MSALQHYIDRKNALSQLFGGEVITQPLTGEGVAELRHCLEADLSPENLNCDGEVSRGEAQKRKAYYLEVEAELDRITPVPV